MAARRPIDPYDIAPASARKVEADFSPFPAAGGTWKVSQVTSWKGCDGDFDGDFTTLVDGLTEAEARAVAALLATPEGRETYVRTMLSESVAVLADAA